LINFYAITVLNNILHVMLITVDS